MELESGIINFNKLKKITSGCKVIIGLDSGIKAWTVAKTTSWMKVAI